MSLDPWRNYDAWKTTNPADEQFERYEAALEELASERSCSPDEITRAELDEYLADQHDADLAAREDHADAERERRMEER